MPSDDVKRKLVAVLSADVAGYSRLMGDDEEGTLARLSAYREIFDGLIAGHDGRVVGSAGDSILAEFASPVEALRCAVEAQGELGTRNDELPEGRRMRFRIGINLGDVMVKGDDIFGQGVNVAARLDGLARPGGICISGSVYDQVSSTLDLGYEDLGPQSVKNIAEPVRTYRIETAPAAATEAPMEPPEKPSIAVLPFENMSGDPEQEYFSDGITEDIITDLSKISALFVIARNSSFTYKGKTATVGQVSRELGVRFVLEGSVRKAANRVRINAQLIDGTTGGHVWAERYDRELEDIFAVQDEVTREIVSALELKLTADEQERLSAKGTDNLDAYDHFLRGRELVWRLTREGTAQARPLLERAIELDPDFAPAFATLAVAHVSDYVNRWSEAPERSLDRAHELAQRAVELDESDPSAHYALGVVLIWIRDHEASIAHSQRALTLDPNFAPAYSSLGNALQYAGRFEEALALFDKALRLDPLYPDIILHFQGHSHFMLGRYKEAAATLRRRLIRNPDSDVSRVLLAACYGHLGRFEEARAEWAEALRVNPDYSLEQKRRILPYKNPADFDRITEGLKKAGLRQ